MMALDEPEKTGKETIKTYVKVLSKQRLGELDDSQRS
jgi:hypothetical protein